MPRPKPAIAPHNALAQARSHRGLHEAVGQRRYRGQLATVLVLSLFAALGSCAAPSAQDRAALAAAGASPQGQFANVSGPEHLAADGYDVVAYFTDGVATPGLESLSVKHDGALYRFASAQHRDMFVSSPQRFVPAYGGWCATAMTRGDFITADPSNFAVRDGRLFLFYKLLLIDAKPAWDADPLASQSHADGQWAIQCSPEAKPK